MAKGKRSGWKTAGLIGLAVLAVASLAYGGYVIADATMKGQTLGDPEIDQTKLFIGIPHYQEGA